MNVLTRLLGESPLSALAKVLFLSLVIGAIMAGFGLTPGILVNRALSAVRSLTHLGFGAVRDIGRFVLTGALVVVPVWLVMRVIGSRR